MPAMTCRTRPRSRTHGQDVGKFRVAQVGDDLGGRRGDDGGKAEGAHCPAEVGLPPSTLQRQALAQRRFVHLHDHFFVIANKSIWSLQMLSLALKFTHFVYHGNFCRPQTLHPTIAFRTIQVLIQRPLPKPDPSKTL